MVQLLRELFLRLRRTDKRHIRTVRPNLVLPDRLQPAEATKAAHLEVAMAAADMVEGLVPTEALLHPAADGRSSSTMSVTFNPLLTTQSELLLTRLI